MRSDSDPFSGTVSGSVASQRPGTSVRKKSTYFSHLFQFLVQVVWGALLSIGIVFLIIQVVVVSQGQTDFCQDYIAAQRLLQGVPVYQTLHCWAGIFAIPTSVEYDTHPPFAALAFLPFGLLPRVPAYTLWGLCCLVFYLLSGFLLLREVGWLSLRSSALFVLGSLGWLVFRGAEQFQNFPQLLTLLLVVAWLLERKGHVRWAGVLLGLATLLKIWPIALLGFMILRRRWQGAFTGGLIIITGTVLTLPFLGPEAYRMYLGPVQANETPWVPQISNSSLEGLITRSLYGLSEGLGRRLYPLVSQMSLNQAVVLSEAVAVLLFGVTLGFLWWCSRSKKSEVEELLGYGLLLTILLLIFPLSWFYGLITLLLPYTTTILALRQLPNPRRFWFLLLGGSMVPLLGDVTWLNTAALWIQHHFPLLSGWATLLLGLPTFGLVLFAGFQAYLLWQAPMNPPQQERVTTVSQQSAEGIHYA